MPVLKRRIHPSWKECRIVNKKEKGAAQEEKKGEQPVMSSTFPYTFWSLSTDLFKKEINLRKRYGSIKRVKAMIIKRGSAMLKNSCSKSIALLQWTERAIGTEQDKNWRYEDFLNFVRLAHALIWANILCHPKKLRYQRVVHGGVLLDRAAKTSLNSLGRVHLH